MNAVARRKLFPGGRRPQTKPGPFIPEMSMQLKNRVTGKGDKGKTVACVTEMSVMFACLKANEFRQTSCEPEIRAFQTCYDVDLVTRRTKKELDRKGEMAPGSADLSLKQINRLLSRTPAFYPPPRK